MAARTFTTESHAQTAGRVGASASPRVPVARTADRTADRVRSGRRAAIIRRALACADVSAVLGALLAVTTLTGTASLRWQALLVGPLFVVTAKAVGLYDRDEHRLHKTTVDEVPTLFGLATVTALVLTLAQPWIVDGLLGQGQVLALWALTFMLLIGLRALARTISNSTQPPERCLVLGDAADAEILAAQIDLSPSIRAQIVGVEELSVNDHAEGVRLPPTIGETLISERVDRVIVARPPGALEGADSLLRPLRELRSYGVKISLLPRGPRVAGPAVELDELPGISLLGIRGLEVPRSSKIVKRSFDIVGSSAGLILLSPVLLGMAIAIKVSSPGPILFRQRRVGLRGEEFTMLKFRSMVTEADQLKDELLHLNEGGPGLFKMAEDPRVTRVGRILRRFSLDELPQLWNVLAGEMSLVGPRPLVREEDGRIEGWYRRRLEVRPGMTGHWQILHSSRRISLDEMAKLDYLYVANWTLWNDIRLLLRTVPFVIRARGV